jgi:hypothetical protein
MFRIGPRRGVAPGPRPDAGHTFRSRPAGRPRLPIEEASMPLASDRARASRARRRAACVGFERLEGRALPSRLFVPPTILNVPNPELRINAPRYVSQQAAGFEVTIARDNASTAASPLTVNFSANLEYPGLADGPVDAVTLDEEPVTFPAGVTSETVHVPVNPGVTNPGSVPIALGVQSGSLAFGADTYIDLVSNSSAVPPTAPAITSASLIIHGRSASAIVITFSGPMNPASVDNVHAYSVNTFLDETYHEYFGLSSYKAETARPLAVAAARYNPATYTVTLVPKKPLKTALSYTISSPIHLTPADTLTDATGTPLLMTSPIGSAPGTLTLPTPVSSGIASLGSITSSGAGTFQFTLRGHQSLSWAAPEPNVTGGS